MRRVIGRTGPNGYQELEPTTPAQQASFAEALATRSPPAISGTDSINFKGRYNGDPFPDCVGPMKEIMQAQADALGISTSGKVYNPGLVRPEYKGRFDPEALVGSTSDVKATLNRHPEWSSEGMVSQTGREPENDPDDGKPYSVAPELVREEVVHELQAAGVEAMPIREFNDIVEKKANQLKGDL